MNSLVIPVYKNEPNIPDLLKALQNITTSNTAPTEVVFVVDGSPDRSFEILRSLLPSQPYSSQLIALSRNFGSLAAVRAGLTVARGNFYAVMAADLQEPPTLINQFFNALQNDEADVVIGTRSSRQDPWCSKIAANLFWWSYRKLVNPELPPGGVDVFGCNLKFKNALLAMHESHSSLIGLIFWLGFRRKSFSYERQGRQIGKSAWTLSKKLTYLSDSVFAFSGFPIKWLTIIGSIGLTASIAVGIVVLVGKITGSIEVPGYAAIMLFTAFFAGLNTLGLGIIGNYIWRVFENTKQRPQSIVLHKLEFENTN